MTCATRRNFFAGGACGLAGGFAWGATAQPAGPGVGPGARGMGAGRDMFADPASYLALLKDELGIDPAREDAWQAYAGTVAGAAAKTIGIRQSMWASMPTASWSERRDMMNRMFQTRQESFDTVRAAAEALLPALTPAQRARARERLPGLISSGPRHMHGPGSGPRHMHGPGGPGPSGSGPASP